MALESEAGSITTTNGALTAINLVPYVKFKLVWAPFAALFSFTVVFDEGVNMSSARTLAATRRLVRSLRFAELVWFDLTDCAPPRFCHPLNELPLASHLASMA